MVELGFWQFSAPKLILTFWFPALIPPPFLDFSAFVTPFCAASLIQVSTELKFGLIFARLPLFLWVGGQVVGWVAVWVLILKLLLTQPQLTLSFKWDWAWQNWGHWSHGIWVQGVFSQRLKGWEAVINKVVKLLRDILHEIWGTSKEKSRTAWLLNYHDLSLFLVVGNVGQ